MRPAFEIRGVDTPGGDATVYVVPCADTGRVQATVKDGKVYVAVLDGDGVTLHEVTLPFKPVCPWAMEKAVQALAGRCREIITAQRLAYMSQAERLARLLVDTYKQEYPHFNPNRAARRAGLYYAEHNSEPRRRWPVPPRFMICKGRRKYK